MRAAVAPDGASPPGRRIMIDGDGRKDGRARRAAWIKKIPTRAAEDGIVLFRMRAGILSRSDGGRDGFQAQIAPAGKSAGYGALTALNTRRRNRIVQISHTGTAA